MYPKNKDTKEVSFIPGNAKQRVVIHRVRGGLYDSSRYIHTAMKVKVGGQDFAIDLDGAQFRIYSPVVPWDEYVTLIGV